MVCPECLNAVEKVSRESVTVTRRTGVGDPVKVVQIMATGELWKSKIDALPESVRECARQYLRSMLERLKVTQR